VAEPLRGDLGVRAGGPPEALRTGYDRVRQLALEDGRNPDDIALTVRGDGVRLKDQAQAIEQLRAYRKIGATVLTLAFTGPDLDTICERMVVFMRDIAPKV